MGCMAKRDRKWRTLSPMFSSRVAPFSSVWLAMLPCADICLVHGDGSANHGVRTPMQDYVGMRQCGGVVETRQPLTSDGLNTLYPSPLTQLKMDNPISILILHIQPTNPPCRTDVAVESAVGVFNHVVVSSVFAGGRPSLFDSVSAVYRKLPSSYTWSASHCPGADPAATHSRHVCICACGPPARS